MKKIYLFLSAAVLSLMGFFTACEDVPAPYGIQDEDFENVPGNEGVLLEESFAANLGRFQNFTTSGEGAWKIDFGTAKATGWDGQANTAGTYYLVSPEVSLADQTEVHLSYEYILAYKSRFPNGDKLFITDKFDSSNADQNWTEITVNHLEADRKDDGKVDWKSFKTIDVQIPEEFLGKNIRFAFCHECNEKGSTTMEIKNVKLAVGKAAGGEDKPQPEVGVKELPYGEAFSKETGLGAFISYTTNGTGAWVADGRGFAKASGFTAPGQPAIPGTYYLVSPEISLVGKTEVHAVYEYIAFRSIADENQKFMINPAFDEKNPEAGWVELKADHVSVTQWTDWKKADIQIPAEYMGKNVRVAFYYNCNEQASTFEVKNFNVAEGKAEGGEVTPQPEGGVQKLPYGEAFSSSFGLFKNYTSEGAGEWIIDFSTAKASGYNSAAQTNVAGVYYLVSPEITLAGQTEAHLSFDYILAYSDKFADGDKLFITDKFNEAAPAEGWTELPITLNEPNKTAEGKIDWKSFHKADVQVPAEYMGKTVRVAFYHKCDENGSTTWEVKNFSIAAGKIGEGGNEGGNEGDNEGDNTPDTGDVEASNGDFETWVDGLPNNWKTESSAGNANLTQSTDAHGGKYSVLVKGEKGNKRLGYKELDLKKGTYTMKAYIKSATEKGGHASFCYVDIPASGSLSGSNYHYGDFINDIPGEWTEYTQVIEIPADGKYSLVLATIKPKGGSESFDILVDDFTVTDANGNFIIK